MSMIWHEERLRIKLQLEIRRLEKWLASQPAETTIKGVKGSSVSPVSTIESLIRIRQRWLASLDTPERVPDQGCKRPVTADARPITPATTLDQPVNG